MKLIDAEQTKLILSELLEVANKENFTAEDVISHACEWVDNLPTAYDVEKVVADLEREKMIICGCHMIETNVIKIDDAIEIVRRGGAE